MGARGEKQTPFRIGARRQTRKRGKRILRVADAPAAVEIQAVLAAELELRGLDLRKLKKKRYAELTFDPHIPVSRAHVLLVGEAAGIDPVTGEGILSLLALINAEDRTTVLLVSHQKDLGLDHARGLLIQDGVLTDTGTFPRGNDGTHE